MEINPFKALFPDPSKFPKGIIPTRNIKDQFDKYFQNGFFKRSKKEHIYVCQIRHNDQVHNALCGNIKLSAFDNGSIRPHESTLIKKEGLQKKMILKRQAQVKPVLVVHKSSAELQIIINHYTGLKPNKSIKTHKGKTTYNFWPIDITSHLVSIKNIFTGNEMDRIIADGHHRVAAIKAIDSDMEEEIEVLTMLMDVDQLNIFSFHRMVDLYPQWNIKSFKKAIAPVAKIKKSNSFTFQEKESNLIKVLVHDQLYDIIWNKAILSSKKSFLEKLHVNLLNNLILDPIFNIKDIRNDERIQFLEGNKPTENIDRKAIFIMPPLSFQDIIEVVSSNNTLPPKSTFFQPRMANCMISQSLLK